MQISQEFSNNFFPYPNGFKGSAENGRPCQRLDRSYGENTSQTTHIKTFLVQSKRSTRVLQDDLEEGLREHKKFPVVSAKN